MYRWLRTTWPAWTAGACFAGWTMLITMLHLLEPGLGYTNRTVSEYVFSEHGYLMQAAFVVLGLGMLSLAVGAARWFAPAPRLYARLLAIAGISAFLALVFNTDHNVEGSARTLTGYLHTGAVIAGTAPVAVAAALAPSLFKRRRAWRPYRRVALAWAVAVLAATVMQVAAAGTDLRGAFQRVDMVVITGWLLYMSAQLPATNRSVHSQPDSGARPVPLHNHSVQTDSAKRDRINNQSL